MNNVTSTDLPPTTSSESVSTATIHPPISSEDPVPWHVVSNLKPPPPPPVELETPSSCFSTQAKSHHPPPPPKTVQRDVDQGAVVTKKMLPTAKKRRGDSVARSSKKQKAMAVEFERHAPSRQMIPTRKGGREYL